MSELGAVKCDYCGLVSQMVRKKSTKTLSAPALWVRIGYTMAVSTGEHSLSHSGKFDDAEAKHIRKQADGMKKYLRSRLDYLHACPGCAQEKVVTNDKFSLPGKATDHYGRESKVGFA